MKVYAKSSNGNTPPETLREHTDNLLKSYKILSQNNFIKYKEKEVDNAIKLMLELHDYGKLNHKFQNKLPIENKERIIIKDLDGYEEIPHAYLSLSFLSKKERNNMKKILQEFFNIDLDFGLLIQYSIAFHHNRNFIFNNENFKKTVEFDLESRKHLIAIDYKLRANINIDDIKQKIESPENFPKYLPYLVFFKGLLHKCDYSASAHLTPEKIYDGDYNKDFITWQNNQSWSLAEFQKDAKTLSKQNKSVVLVASTGVGKTEYSMNWINGNKAFYLLGLRMATNKMYERFREIFNCHNRENVTLLHSTAGNILMDENDDVFSYFNKSKEGKQLSYPITIATADQLVTSVFKYPGFELKYFTASYSYIVVDEIQSFAPEAIASIVVFLQEIHKLGGRFLLMTATLPPFVKDDFKNLLEIEFPEHKDQLSDKKRHKIELIEEKIEENILDYIESNKKVLIICNTVKKAQEIAELLESSGFTPKLLHSKFIVKDRAEKENEIMNDAPNGKGGEKSVIWISTQIVEASLDIDFDLLLTENATIDSLLQRFGRCYRGREYKAFESNVFIFKNDEISERIYDKEIMNRTWDILLNNYNKKLITEKDKQIIINEVFKKGFIENTKYYSEYKRYKDLLNLGYRADTKRKAQEDFRKIMNSYLVIPESIYTDNLSDIDKLIKILDSEKAADVNNREFWEKRTESERELMEFTIGIQLWKQVAEKSLISEYFSHSKYCINKKLFVLKDCVYDYKNGLILLKESKVNDNIL